MEKKYTCIKCNKLYEFHGGESEFCFPCEDEEMLKNYDYKSDHDSYKEIRYSTCIKCGKKEENSILLDIMCTKCSQEEFQKELLNHKECQEKEDCIYCSIRDCPFRDELHYHHDGCSSCYYEYLRNKNEKNETD